MRLSFFVWSIYLSEMQNQFNQKFAVEVKENFYQNTSKFEVQK